MEQGGLDEAEALLQRALECAPDYAQARLDYALILLQRQRHLPARKEAERLLKQDPNNRDYLKQFAAASVGLGDYEPVIALYERLLVGQPEVGLESADLRLWRAHALKISGRRTEAVADYRASLHARPNNGVAWFSLSNLKTYDFSDDDIAQMQAAETQADLQEMDRIYLCFALGKALEDRTDYQASWRYYARGNALRRGLGRYRPDVAEACAARLKGAFTADVFADRAGWGLDDPAPIFIVGMPRSGSTLVEQILASHSSIEGTQELTEVADYVGDLCGLDPECRLPLRSEALLRLTAAEVRALAERFLVDTLAYRRSGRPLFIDKAPNNFWHVGLIQMMLPRATIIDVRREPMACCFGNFKQLFGGANQEFAYGVEDLARHYRTYLDLMRHWGAVLPGRILRVQYEDIVVDPNGGIRQLLEACALPFEAACLTPHETRRSVRTPSSEQVRQPIGRDGLHQWRHFAPWLTPLEDALGDALISYRI